MKACPFCQKRPEELIMHTAHFAVIYNLSPILPGHCLIISREHKESLFDFNEAQLAELMVLSQKLAKMLCDIFDTQSFNWAIQEQGEAGQSVEHFHMHVIPRQIGDLEYPGAWYAKLERSEQLPIDSSERFKLTNAQLAELTQRLRTRSQQYFKDDDTVQW